jgi:hypothetical protein
MHLKIQDYGSDEKIESERDLWYSSEIGEKKSERIISKEKRTTLHKS